MEHKIEHNDINENFNTLFCDTYIMEMDIKSMKSHMERLLTAVEKKSELITRLINITNGLTLEIHTLKHNQKKTVHRNIIGTSFCAGFGVFSSFAVVTMVMRYLER